MVTCGVRAEEREVLPITFTNLFIRHNLKSWNWVEVLSKLMLPLAVFVLSHPPSPSSQCSGLVRPLPPSNRPEHQGIMGCRAELQGEREENSCYVTSKRESRGGQSEGLTRNKKLWNSVCTGEKNLSGSLFHIKTRAHPTALEY